MLPLRGGGIARASKRATRRCRGLDLMSFDSRNSIPGGDEHSDGHPECIGLVAIGLMGAALAERLLAGGMRVVGYDIRPAACAALAELGGEPVADAASVAARCERILLSLPYSGVVE